MRLCAPASAAVCVRATQEGKAKFQQILDLLLAGGYFRARIQVLDGRLQSCVEILCDSSPTHTHARRA